MVASSLSVPIIKKILQTIPQQQINQGINGCYLSLVDRTNHAVVTLSLFNFIDWKNTQSKKTEIHFCLLLRHCSTQPSTWLLPCCCSIQSIRQNYPNKMYLQEQNKPFQCQSYQLNLNGCSCIFNWSTVTNLKNIGVNVQYLPSCLPKPLTTQAQSQMSSKHMLLILQHISLLLPYLDELSKSKNHHNKCQESLIVITLAFNNSSKQKEHNHNQRSNILIFIFSYPSCPQKLLLMLVVLVVEEIVQMHSKRMM